MPITQGRPYIKHPTALHSSRQSYNDADALTGTTTTYTGLPAQAVSYLYYPNGSRQNMITPAGTFSYSYDVAGRAPSLTKMGASGALMATNTFGAHGLVSRYRNGLGGRTFYTFDAQGSVAQRLDIYGNVLTSRSYAAHGMMIGKGVADPFGYKARWGYYTDTETGLLLLTHRYYDPGTGRFLTRDPIGYNGGINLYAYVRNSPSNLIDPLGLHLAAPLQKSI